MDSAGETFNKIRQRVLNLIQDKKEVTSNTKHKVSGIYIIYIDNFTDDTFIPIYVGQSVDIQKRFKEHYTELLSLNRLPYEEYARYFFEKESSFYEGSFKSPKIFKYMIENKCTLDDYHMVIVEEVDEDNLKEKEQEYLKQLMPSIFGFNQLDSYLKKLELHRSRSVIDNSQIKDYLNELTEDIQSIHNFYHYGYAKFNLEHALPLSLSFEGALYESLDEDNIVSVEEANAQLKTLRGDAIAAYDELNELGEKRDKQGKIFSEANEDYSKELKTLQRDAEAMFSEMHYDSTIALNNFIKSVIHEDPKLKKDFNTYIKSQDNQLDFYEYYGGQINSLQNKYQHRMKQWDLYETAKTQYDEKLRALRHEQYKLIFPSEPYSPFPLRSGSTRNQFQHSAEYDYINTCQIQFYIANNGYKRGRARKDPYIIRVDYSYVDKLGKRYDRTYYIDNEITRNCQIGNIYVEKDYYDISAAVRKDKFRIISVIDGVIDNTFISIQAEYKHGINDYTIKDKELTALSNVLKEIQQLGDDETRYNIKSTESYRCLERCMKAERVHENPFVQKILSKKLPKMRKKSSGKKS